MTPEQIRAELAILNTNANSLRTEAIATQWRAYNPHPTDHVAELWEAAEAAEEAWLSAMDLAARAETALIEALIERDRASFQAAAERYENGGAVA